MRGCAQAPVLCKAFSCCTYESDSKRARFDMVRNGIEALCDNHIDWVVRESPELDGARYDVVRE